MGACTAVATPSRHVYLGHRAPEDWIDTIDTAAAKSATLELLDGWDTAPRAA